ncbi:MAG: alpha/beta hydrolase [Pseudomonadota bacterium]
MAAFSNNLLLRTLHVRWRGVAGSRRARPSLIALSVALIAVVTSASCYSRVSHDSPGKLIDIGGYRLHIVCEGYGTPTVLVDSGLGGSSLEWRYVVDQVREFTRVCSYDRSGYGYSDMGPRPRTSSRISNELFLLTESLDVDRPFILVGHSFGGFNMQLFSRRFPYLVAGLVLVDSSHPEQVERFLQPPISLNTAPSSRWGLVQFSDPPQPHKKLPAEIREKLFMQSIHWRTKRTLAREYLSFKQSAAQIRRTPVAPKTPTVVLTRGKRVWPNNERGAMIEDLWLKMQSELAQQSELSAHIVATNSGHHVHIDQPGLVSYAIALLTDRFRLEQLGQANAERQSLSNRDAIDFGAAMWLRDTLFEEKNLTTGYDQAPDE